MGDIKGNDLLEYMDDAVYSFGEVAEDSVVHYSFPFKKGKESVEYIEKGCGCTSAYWDSETNAISGTLDMSRARPQGGYQEGDNVVTKYVFVWLNDGNRRFISDEKLQKKLNPDKTWLRLQLSGKVVKK